MPGVLPEVNCPIEIWGPSEILALSSPSYLTLTRLPFPIWFLSSSSSSSSLITPLGSTQEHEIRITKRTNITTKKTTENESTVGVVRCMRAEWADTWWWWIEAYQLWLLQLRQHLCLLLNWSHTSSRLYRDVVERWDWASWHDTSDDLHDIVERKLLTNWHVVV